MATFYCTHCHTYTELTVKLQYQYNQDGNCVCFECIGKAEVHAFQKGSFRARWRKQIEGTYTPQNNLQLIPPTLEMTLELAEQLLN